MSKCKVSGSNLNLVLDFGKQPLGNGFLEERDFSKEYFYNMGIGFSEESKLLQLIEQPEPQKMFHENYAFYSSTSTYMQNHFELFANQVLDSGYISRQSPFVVELGCNDGILLKHFALKNINHLGIEPSLNVAAEANKLGIKTRSDFFSENIAEEIILEHGKADAFLAANVMCHIPNIVSVVRGIKKLLKPTGIVMFEEPYLGDVITKTSYDQIYDEHIFIFSGHSVQYLFANEGLELIDVIPQKTHGGSMRYILAHKDAYPVCNSVSQLLNKEESMGLDRISTFHKFKKDVEKSKDDLVQLLTNLSNQGKKIAGYAATSKSTTILNFCGIGPSLISYICDTTPIKQGKFSPGMHIPVVPYDYFVENPPDFTLLFAWNHMDEILAKEKAYVSGGGKWITHVPEVRIL